VAAVTALIALVFAAPRAAVGADRPAGRLFTAQSAPTLDVIRMRPADQNQGMVVVRQIEAEGVNVRSGQQENRFLTLQFKRTDSVRAGTRTP
jgi:hypothetical protein